MKIIALNESDDPAESVLPPDTEWCVYMYTSGSYEGHGHAYCGTKHGEFYEAYLGHCSCYGPWDDDWYNNPRSWNKIPREDLIGMHLSGDDDQSKAFREAIYPLIGESLR